MDALPLDIIEVQGDLETIARHKLATARSVSHHDLIATEDVSLGYEQLGGFPGPYVKWALESGGGEGLSRIGAGLGSRRATAECLVALWDGFRVSLHRGSISGTILEEPRGERGFGWDAWFLPEGSELTFGEMTADQKAEISHRSRAWRSVARHLEDD